VSFNAVLLTEEGAMNVRFLSFAYRSRMMIATGNFGDTKEERKNAHPNDKNLV